VVSGSETGEDIAYTGMGKRERLLGRAQNRFFNCLSELQKAMMKYWLRAAKENGGKVKLTMNPPEPGRTFIFVYCSSAYFF
jgi:hypothetical protein